MQPVTQYTNDSIAILSPTATMPVGGPPSQVAVSHGSDYALEVRALGLLTAYTAGAGGVFVYLRNPGVGDVLLYQQAALASPFEIVIPMHAPLLVGRGFQFLVSHAGAAVTVAGLVYMRLNALIIPD